MLEIEECSKVTAHKYGYYSAVAQPVHAVTISLVFRNNVFRTFGCKFIAKLIHNTENFSNFVFEI